MIPSVLPDKLPGERVAVYLQLATAIGTDTIVGLPVFASDPAGLVFTSVASIDASQTAAALCDGGIAGIRYTLWALCTLASGQIVQPVVALPVTYPRNETLPAGGALVFTPLI